MLWVSKPMQPVTQDGPSVNCPKIPKIVNVIILFDLK